MSDSTEAANTALLEAIAAGLEDMRKRIGRVEALMNAQANDVNKLTIQVTSLKDEVGRLDTQVSDWIKKTEPVTKAYSDVPKVLRGVVATTTVVIAVLTAWWSGGISTVIKVLQQPPVQP
jgi:ABC-type transporter Mla subunit MlaD